MTTATKDRGHLVYEPKRLSLPLTSADLIDLEAIRNAPAYVRLATGIADETSEAQLVHAVFLKGLEKLQEERDAIEYQKLAEDAEYKDYDAERRSARAARSRRSTSAA